MSATSLMATTTGRDGSSDDPLGAYRGVRVELDELNPSSSTSSRATTGHGGGSTNRQPQPTPQQQYYHSTRDHDDGDEMMNTTTQEDELNQWNQNDSTSGRNHSSSSSRHSLFGRLSNWWSSRSNNNSLSTNTHQAQSPQLHEENNNHEQRPQQLLQDENFQTDDLLNPDSLNAISRRRTMRIIVLIGLVTAIILAHAIIMFVVMIASKQSTTQDGGENSNSGENSGETSDTRRVFMYFLTVPNAIILSCLLCCCGCLCAKRMFTLYLNYSSSSFARRMKAYLLRHGLLQYEGSNDEDFWDPEEISQRNQRLLQMLQQRGIDISSLRLMMIDRDFNEQDYETLLQLEQYNQQPAGLSESALAQLPVFKIPQLDSSHPPLVEKSDEDSHLYGHDDEILLRNPASSSPNTATTTTPNNSSATPTQNSGHTLDSSIPECSETLARELLDETCCICLSKYEQGEVVCTLPTCLHRYHRDCVHQALRMRNQCPICKTAI
ncbi:hypothetical protein FDP41_008006 [Naegleria fowleri]|uniref:RING-type E3 ubiquitin transferase n=1 Tax=Naegleria fowleri TaxID=5763 RepID=A0A6A5CA49_NAEFO|nr:uncharacterized protein FDP41_008006 [Naegleria fowleri]KAF0984091.1 hypothetical protein FDP41_008006 [Naegleria fowleri]CAG4713241.1 unnamed protein product [Naegleria fowleri]